MSLNISNTVIVVIQFPKTEYAMDALDQRAAYDTFHLCVNSTMLEDFLQTTLFHDFIIDVSEELYIFIFSVSNVILPLFNH